MSWIFAQIMLWLVYWPLLMLLKCLLFWLPKLSERRVFENKNEVETGARSFGADNLKADLCFEFSSEGEYQQVASLIDDALANGLRLELVFFSPSVEKTVIELYSRHSKQIRYLRYPILSLKFSNWITSSQLVLVRYDLFPEFLLWSMKPGRKLKFVWVTFKKERVKQASISLFKKAFLLRSDMTIFASEADYELGKSLGINGTIYDFRMEQIKRRLEHKNEKFSRIFPQYPSLKLILDSYPRGKRLILGNAWPVDLSLLKNLSPDILLVIVPHKLETEILEEMRQTLNGMGRKMEILSDTSTEAPFSNTILINKKGVLCELYADFGKAYVGGGFGVSVHSILEPLVAGSEHLSCGPMNHRSTEFDLALGFGHTKEVKNAEEFSRWLSEDITEFKVHDRLKTHISAYPQFAKEVLSC